jgi:hypothetical protein
MAAKVLCEELTWLVHGNGSFWERVPQVAAELREEGKKRERELLQNIAELVDKEGEIFNKLKIKDESADRILREVYGSLRIAQLDLPDFASDAAFRELREDLNIVAKRICHESKGAISRGLANIWGSKGLKILAGAATATANVIVSFTADGGAISWVSITAGFITIKGNLEDLKPPFGEPPPQ